MTKIGKHLYCPVCGKKLKTLDKIIHWGSVEKSGKGPVFWVCPNCLADLSFMVLNGIKVFDESHLTKNGEALTDNHLDSLDNLLAKVE